MDAVIMQHDAAVEEMRVVVERWHLLRLRWALTPMEAMTMLGSAGRPMSGQGGFGNAGGDHAAERLLRLFVDLGDAVAGFGGDGGAGWLRTSSTTLAGRTPLEAMSGRPEAVRWFIDVLTAAGR